MNTKILELAKQAGLYNEKTPEEVPGFTAAFEKFAQLVWEIAYDQGYNDGADQTILKERG